MENSYSHLWMEKFILNMGNSVEKVYCKNLLELSYLVTFVTMYAIKRMVLGHLNKNGCL